MSKIQRKWWFASPVTILTVGSSLWLFWTLGLLGTFRLHFFAGVILFVVSMYSFQRFYSHLLWSALLWFAPTAVGEKPLNS